METADSRPGSPSTYHTSSPIDPDFSVSLNRNLWSVPSSRLDQEDDVRKDFSPSFPRRHASSPALPVDFFNSSNNKVRSRKQSSFTAVTNSSTNSASSRPPRKSRTRNLQKPPLKTTKSANRLTSSSQTTFGPPAGSTTSLPSTSFNINFNSHNYNYTLLSSSPNDNNNNNNHILPVPSSSSTNPNNINNNNDNNSSSNTSSFSRRALRTMLDSPFMTPARRISPTSKTVLGFSVPSSNATEFNDSPTSSREAGGPASSKNDTTILTIDDSHVTNNSNINNSNNNNISNNNSSSNGGDTSYLTGSSGGSGVSIPNIDAHGRKVYGPTDWQYQVAERLFLEGAINESFTSAEDKSNSAVSDEDPFRADESLSTPNQRTRKSSFGARIRNPLKGRNNPPSHAAQSYYHNSSSSKKSKPSKHNFSLKYSQQNNEDYSQFEDANEDDRMLVNTPNTFSHNTNDSNSLAAPPISPFTSNHPHHHHHHHLRQQQQQHNHHYNNNNHRRQGSKRKATTEDDINHSSFNTYSPNSPQFSVPERDSNEAEYDDGPIVKGPALPSNQHAIVFTLNNSSRLSRFRFSPNLSPAEATSISKAISQRSKQDPSLLSPQSPPLATTNNNNTAASKADKPFPLNIIPESLSSHPSSFEITHDEVQNDPASIEKRRLEQNINKYGDSSRVFMSGPRSVKTSLIFSPCDDPNFFPVPPAKVRKVWKHRSRPITWTAGSRQSNYLPQSPSKVGYTTNNSNNGSSSKTNNHTATISSLSDPFGDASSSVSRYITQGRHRKANSTPSRPSDSTNSNSNSQFRHRYSQSTSVTDSYYYGQTQQIASTPTKKKLSSSPPPPHRPNAHQHSNQQQQQQQNRNSKLHKRETFLGEAESQTYLPASLRGPRVVYFEKRKSAAPSGNENSAAAAAALNSTMNKDNSVWSLTTGSDNNNTNANNNNQNNTNNSNARTGLSSEFGTTTYDGRTGAGSSSDASSYGFFGKSALLCLPVSVVEPLSLVPLGAWCFVGGFAFFPLWWFGSFYPQTTTVMRATADPAAAVNGGGANTSTISEEEELSSLGTPSKKKKSGLRKFLLSPRAKKNNVVLGINMDVEKNNNNNNNNNMNNNTNNLNDTGEWWEPSQGYGVRRHVVSWPVELDLPTTPNSGKSPNDLPGPKVFSDWLTDDAATRRYRGSTTPSVRTPLSPTFRIDMIEPEQGQTYKAAVPGNQRAVHTWKVRCRFMSVLSVFILIPIIVLVVLSATKNIHED